MLLAEFFIPHGHCYLWKPELVGLHIVSDVLTALAYYSIPLMLIYFVQKRRDVPFNWIFLLFSTFIISCGTGHIMDIWTLWHPNYWLSGFVKAFTAVVSLYTAYELVWLLPQALAMPSAAQFEAVKTEIKERQRVEAALLREKTHLALAQKVAHVGSWELDLATQEITWSDETFRIYGLHPEQPTPTITEHRQHIHPDDRTIWDATINQPLEGKSCELEFRIVRPDGCIRHLLCQGKPIFNSDTQVEKLFKTVLDITERKQAEAALQRQLAAVEAAMDGIAILNSAQEYIYLNKAHIKLYGYDSSTQLLGKTWRDLYYPDELRRLEQDIFPILSHQGHWHGEAIGKKRDGSTFCEEVSLTLTADGGLICVCRDITERKQAEIVRQQQVERERLVGAILLRIRQSLELDEILNTTVAEVRQFLQTDRVLIYRFNSDWSGQVAVESVGADWTAILDITFHDPCFGKDYAQLYQQGRVRAIANIHTAGLTPCYVELLAPLQVIASLTVPIMQGEKLWGLLIAHHCRGEKQWQSYEIELLQQLATQVAIAVQQSELYSRVQAELIERQRIEQELRVSEELYRSVVTAMSEGIVLQQADGQITACNASTERILGLSAQQMIGKTSTDPCWQTIHEDGSPFPGELHPAMVTLRTGEPQSNVIMGIHKPNGSLTWISINSQPLFHPGETKAHAVVTSFSDISDRKRAEEALRALTQQERERALQLEQALIELQRSQTQLVQNEKMASLGQLVAGVAHEINNPTSFIYGNIYLASDYAQDLLHLIELYGKHYPEPVIEIAEQVECIDLDFIALDFPKLLASMKEGVHRISEIVQSLRNFSRLDEMECKSVNIHEGIDNTLLILQHRLTQQSKRPKIQVIKEYSELPLVECYPSQLNQVFMNILSNAIDALEVSVVSGQWSVVNELTTDNGQWTTDKTPMIRIRTEVVEQNWVVIRIADNGLGLTAEVQPRVFDPFFTTKPVGKGTGLGLSISYQIVVDKHRGQLTCHSVPGQGAEFVIQLPIALVYSTPRQRVVVNAIAQDRTFDKVTETASRKSKVKS